MASPAVQRRRLGYLAAVSRAVRAGFCGPNRTFLAIATVVLLGACPGVARAQILETYLPAQVLGVDSFLTQPPPEYTAQGVRVGSFILHPQLQESVGYNSNVLGEAGSPGSPQIDTSATLSAGSDWDRNSLSVYANVLNVQTPQVRELDYTNTTASVAGSLDIGQGQLRGSYTYLQYNLLPNQLGGLGLTQKLPVTTNDARVAYSAPYSQVSIIPDFDFNSYRYSNSVQNGVLQGYGYLSRDVYTPGVTVRYELAPQRDLVFVLSGASAQYLEAAPGQPFRNYFDVEALAGVDFSADGVIRYRALVGYEKRDYASSQIPSASTPIVEASAIWTPTRLTTLNATIVHRLEDSIEQNSFQYTYTDLRITADHQLRRNVLLEAYVDLGRANYAQQGGIQSTYGGGASAAWLLNRNVRLRASVDLTDASAPPPNNYTRSVFLLQLQFGL